MAVRLQLVLLLALLVVPGATGVAQGRPDSALATQDTLLEARTREVAATLRCPVCQNLSIQDSPSQLARDMKRVVRERLAAGETPEQVQRYFVSRYGEWVLLKPKARGVNLSVWLLPLVALLAGAGVIWFAVKRWVERGELRAAGPEPAPGAEPHTPDLLELRGRRSALQASLQELESELAAGRLTTADFEFLRQRDQGELGVVNDALKRLKKTGVPAPSQPAAAARAPVRHGTFRGWAAVGWAGGLAAFAIVAGLSLKGSIIARAPGATITGGQAGAIPVAVGEAGPLDSLRVSQLETRVRRDSTDQEALIELGHMYLTQGRLQEAAQLDMRAIRAQPDAPGTAEAFAHMGMILWSAGETDGALQSLDKALFLHPDLPEALLYKGIILFAGVRDLPRAAEVLQRYLDVAPPSANTARVKGMLDAARANRQ
jgi:cytochrome c-type biogenesis protein CcmH